MEKGMEKGIEKGMEKGIQKGMRQGLERGLMAERALLCRLTRRRFGKSCAEQLERLLELVYNPERLAEVGEWIIDCETGDEFLAWVRKWASRNDA